MGLVWLEAKYLLKCNAQGERDIVQVLQHQLQLVFNLCSTVVKSVRCTVINNDYLLDTPNCNHIYILADTI